jgi:predicted phosphodiesterase
MNTLKLLDKVYKNAEKMKFNNDSRIIFFSDIHRGDNSLSDDFAHNQNIYCYALNYYFDRGYSYIEVGDGDELWEHGKFKHLRSAHSDIYYLLKKFYDNNRFLMLYGNHNMSFKYEYFVRRNLDYFYDDYDEKKKELFKGIKVHEAVILVHEETGKEVFVTHGHQGDFINDQIWLLMKLLSRYIWRFFNIIGFRNPASPAKNRIKRHKIEKNFSKWIDINKTMMIIGHTHRPKFPKVNEASYFNTGCCVHPRNITGIELNNGEISLIEWKVRPSENGILKISKKNISGPENVEKFMY